jgi:hypothetical protein
VPLILPVIVDTPGISNKNLKQFLLGYGKDYALSDSILQEARTEAKAKLFRKSEENAQYAKGMKTYLERSSHVVELRYTSRKETVRNVERLVVSKELLHLKAKDNSTLDKEGRSAYWNTWKKENYDLLVNQLGYKTTKGHFLHGVFYAPSFSKATVPELQTVFTADACHLNFGEYTMFLCHGVTANANMLPVGFAIIFGNENASNWKEFWRFILCMHPLINRGEVTMISDQDKGIKSAIKKTSVSWSLLLFLAPTQEHRSAVWRSKWTSAVLCTMDVQQVSVGRLHSGRGSATDTFTRCTLKT